MLRCSAIEFTWIEIREGGPRSVDCSKTVVPGEVAEWLMAPVLKTGIPERVSGVRIPPSPPLFVRRVPNTIRLSELEIAVPANSSRDTILRLFKSKRLLP